MVEKQRTRVEEAMTNMVNEVDKLHLRRMQVIYLFTVLIHWKRIYHTVLEPYHLI
jgi:hypothetical protein